MMTVQTESPDEGCCLCKHNEASPEEVESWIEDLMLVVLLRQPDGTSAANRAEAVLPGCQACVAQIP